MEDQNNNSNAQAVEKQNNENNHQAIQDEDQLDDLQDLGLFHSSSLRQPQNPHLQPHSLQTWELKRTYDQDNNEMYNQYKLIKKLGQGAFGQVMQVSSGGQEYAMKICSLLGLEKQRFFAADGDFANSLDVLKNQLNILKRLKHHNIGQCLQIIHGNDKICTINELGSLGQLMDWSELDECYYRNKKIVQYMGNKYKTSSFGDVMRVIFIELCHGVKYMHDNNITNRDVKVDNILGRETQEMGNQIIIVDFTTVRFKGNDDISYFSTGTPGFRGPEHQFAGSDGYSCKATDVWSVGIAMWLFYHQKMPFPGDNQFQRDASAKNIELTFSPECPKVITETIQKMVRKDWKDRITIEQALQMLQQQQ